MPGTAPCFNTTNHSRGRQPRSCRSVPNRRFIDALHKDTSVMPMIDIYAAAGTFADIKKLSADAAALVKSVEQVPDIPMFRKNTAAFVHEMPAAAISNVDGDSNYVRVQVLTNAGALDRDKQIALVAKMTDLVAEAANDPEQKTRTW